MRGCDASQMRPIARYTRHGYCKSDAGFVTGCRANTTASRLRGLGALVLGLVTPPRGGEAHLVLVEAEAAEAAERPARPERGVRGGVLAALEGLWRGAREARQVAARHGGEGVVLVVVARVAEEPVPQRVRRVGRVLLVGVVLGEVLPFSCPRLTIPRLAFY